MTSNKCLNITIQLSHKGYMYGWFDEQIFLGRLKPERFGQSVACMSQREVIYMHSIESSFEGEPPGV